MPHDDLEGRLEALAPEAPRAGLEREILAAVETRLARRLPRARVLGLAAVAALLMAGVFVLGMHAADRSPPGAERPVEWAVGGPEDEYEGDPIAVPDCPEDPEHSPRVVFDLPKEGLDFGDVSQGVVFERDVVFRNEGDGLLCVHRVMSGCGCIKAVLLEGSSRVEPGGTGHLRVTLDTRGRDGALRKTTRLQTNDAEKPLVGFSIRARVALGLRVAPGFLNFGRVPPKREAAAVVRLRAPLADGAWDVVEVTGVTAGEGAPIAYEWRVTTIADEQDRVLDVRVEHPGMPEAGVSLTETITIRTTYAKRREVTIRAHLLVVPPILATPRRAVLGFVPADDALPPAHGVQKDSVRIRLVPAEPEMSFRIVGCTFVGDDGSPLAEGESGFVAAPVASEAKGTWVEVRYDGKLRSPGPLKATLVVRTDAKEMPEVRIECYATVPR